MNRATVLVLMLMLPFIAAQSPPPASIPAQQLPQLFPSNVQQTIDGVVLAYDWTTRDDMEGARVERFIFKTAAKAPSGGGGTSFIRVVLLWHPAEKPRILPDDFYSSKKKWRLTLNSATPFDFVRQYCEKEAAPTFTCDSGEGRKIELPRYVSPAVLPPSAGLAKNFSTAIRKHPTPPPMPDTRLMRCMYLDKVTSLQP